MLWSGHFFRILPVHPGRKATCKDKSPTSTIASSARTTRLKTPWFGCSVIVAVISRSSHATQGEENLGDQLSNRCLFPRSFPTSYPQNNFQEPGYYNWGSPSLQKSQTYCPTHIWRYFWSTQRIPQQVIIIFWPSWRNPPTYFQTYFQTYFPAYSPTSFPTSSPTYFPTYIPTTILRHLKLFLIKIIPTPTLFKLLFISSKSNFFISLASFYIFILLSLVWYLYQGACAGIKNVQHLSMETPKTRQSLSFLAKWISQEYGTVVCWLLVQVFLLSSSAGFDGSQMHALHYATK
jgi:hypothetical protein